MADYDQFAHEVRNTVTPLGLLLLLVGIHRKLEVLQTDRLQWAALSDEILERLDRMFDNPRPMNPKELAKIKADLECVYTDVTELQPRFTFEYQRWKNIQS
jgi:hypothetical protein